MRFSPTATRLAIFLVLSSATTTAARADYHTDALLDAERALNCAQLELRLYRQVELPRQLRQFDAAIKLTKAEIAMQKRLLREYRPFDKFQTGRPLVVTIEYTRLQLAEAELRLKDLQAERWAVQRFKGLHFRQLARNIEIARAHAEALRGDNMPD
jgi:hypothetical protein